MDAETPEDEPCACPRSVLSKLDVFAHEMFHYLLARRLCLWYKPLTITITESSEFIEEVGKSVLIKWIWFHSHLREILSDDFPKYVNTREAFVKYAKMRSIEMYDNTDLCPTERLLRVTAFLLEMGCFCYEMGHLHFPDMLADCWKEIFLFLCFENFLGVGGWGALHRECAEYSVAYDELKVERDLGSRVRRFKLKYLVPEDVLGDHPMPESCAKSVTVFPTYDSVNETKIYPPKCPAGKKLPIKFQIDFGRILVVKREKCASNMNKNIFL